MGAVASGTQWTITSGDHEAVIVEVGGGLREYRVAGVEVLDGYADNEMSPASHGQILAPWPNRIRDGRYTFAGESYQLFLSEPARHNAIHGLVNWARWHQVGEATADSVTVEYDLPPQPAVFAPGPEAGEIEEIAQKLREAAGLPKEPTGEVAKK